MTNGLSQPGRAASFTAGLPRIDGEWGMPTGRIKGRSNRERIIVLNLGSRRDVVVATEVYGGPEVSGLKARL
jgi:hypothetical protein